MSARPSSSWADTSSSAASARANPTLGRHQQLVAVDYERSIERLGHPLGYEMRAIDAADDQHRELVAPQPGDGVTGSYAAQDPLAGTVQQLVARRMPESVVHQFEVIEIKSDQSHRKSVALAHLHRMIKAVVEQRAIGQPGQGISEQIRAKRPHQNLDRQRQGNVDLDDEPPVHPSEYGIPGSRHPHRAARRDGGSDREVAQDESRGVEERYVGTDEGEDGAPNHRGQRRRVGQRCQRDRHTGERGETH